MVKFIDFLLENQSRLIKELTVEFGGQTVFCRSERYIPENSDMKSMQKILNSNIFDGKNPNIPIIYGNTSKLNAVRKNDGLPEFVDSSFFDVFSASYDFSVDEKYVDDISSLHGKITRAEYGKITVRYLNRKILLNQDRLKDANFIFFVNSLCHEMIHQYDTQFGEMPDMLKLQSMYGFDIDDHSTPTYLKLKNKAMHQKLKIIDDSHGLDMKKLNDEAFDFLISERKGDTRELEVFKNENGEWLVDMTQFKNTENSRTISRQYRSLDMSD